MSEHQFTFSKAEPRSMGGQKHHEVVAMVDGQPAGKIQWRPATGEVHDLQVEPVYRRQGIATALWEEAHRVAAQTRGVKPPKHSTQRTNDGEAWARSFGTRLPKRDPR